MAANYSTSKRLSLRFPRIPISCAIIGDSTIKYVHENFNPVEPGTPGFVCYSGARFRDVPGLLQHVAPTVPKLVLHVGTIDIADNGATQALEELTQLVKNIRQQRPQAEICLSLPLPRALNRRRHGVNKRFVHWFNREASRYVNQVRRLCHRRELGRGVFYLDHVFQEMPPWRVLAADGLHPSFEGVAMLALHYRRLLTTKTSRWHPRQQTLPPAGMATTASSGTPQPGTPQRATNVDSSRTPPPQAQKSTTPPGPPQMAYNLRSFADVTRRPTQPRQN
ncbi:hypothetical protein HPB49_006659 [Dermacentor silvarum]|uniref:Uncharacterized protein n=1 Tax=Dermacentor silvarum TaxID=543639 RepID=A0ACB8DWQ1_DERSI|nr:hypothetical protein HPB49_006659 [Dermacentor silvarum]